MATLQWGEVLSGEIAKAERFFRNLPQSCKAAVHLAIAAVKDESAVELQEKGQLRDAEQLHREALRIFETILGNSNALTLDCKNNLAIVLAHLGHFAEAEQLHQEALKGRRSLLGENHPDTLGSKNNLAIVLAHLGHFAEAEELHREALEGMQSVLGDTHPDTLSSKNTLANVLQEQGRLSEAEQLYREALEAMRSVLGENHPDTLSSKNNLANLSAQLGRQGERLANGLGLDEWKKHRKDAEEHRREALDGLQDRLGPQHHCSLICRVARANTFAEQGRLTAAAAELRLVVEGYRDQLGGDHPRTRAIAVKLMRILQEQKGEEFEEEEKFENGFTAQDRSKMESAFRLECEKGGLKPEDAEGKYHIIINKVVVQFVLDLAEQRMRRSSDTSELSTAANDTSEEELRQDGAEEGKYFIIFLYVFIIFIS